LKNKHISLNYYSFTPSCGSSCRTLLWAHIVTAALILTGLLFLNNNLRGLLLFTLIRDIPWLHLRIRFMWFIFWVFPRPFFVLNFKLWPITFTTFIFLWWLKFVFSFMMTRLMTYFLITFIIFILLFTFFRSLLKLNAAMLFLLLLLHLNLFTFIFCALRLEFCLLSLFFFLLLFTLKLFFLF
jgi:hypothetical protein